MIYKYFFLFVFIFIFSCADKSKKINYSQNFKSYSNKGFALVYEDKLYKKRFINKKLDNRSLIIFNNNLIKETPVRVTNLITGKSLVAKVGVNAKFPIFYNSVISKRIATDLGIDFDQPYVEIKTLYQNNSFIINKAKTFDEEKKVATKAPVEGILIENISSDKNKVKKIDVKTNSNVSFQYIIKIADLYFENSAKILKKRLNEEYNINDIKIKKISKNSYRIYKGPFNNLDSIKRQYNDIIRLNFENIEILKL
tara:strand:+ start:1845 stop:2606 length:762 start_codon:yes stop_codon:yes gene_type:complete